MYENNRQCKHASPGEILFHERTGKIRRYGNNGGFHWCILPGLLHIENMWAMREACRKEKNKRHL